MSPQFLQNLIENSTAYEPYHYTDFDLKVIDYMSKLERQDVTRSYISQTRERSELAICNILAVN